MKIVIALFFLAVLSSIARADDSTLKLRKIEGVAPEGFVEIRGVAAGAFDADLWVSGAPFSLPDHRSPVLEPREGKFRNIYAPSVVQTNDGWRVFYGAWDGEETGNDRIYSLETKDFLSFSNRQTVIEHGEFIHVCNVSALRLESGAYAMMCSTLAEFGGLGKPVFFSSVDGASWNDSPAPYAARLDDLISMTGYEGYEAADINGMNVLLHENNRFHLYFCNFKDFGKVYRASSKDGRHFAFEGAVLDRATVVNDVKKLIDARGRASYLMALHRNTDRLWYSLSTDATKFPPMQVLAEHQGIADRYMVAVGWVVGEMSEPAHRVLGVLYGAGAKPSLDANRILARWFQKKAIISTDDRTIEPVAALGPDRQLIPIDRDVGVSGRILLYHEDGRTQAGSSKELQLKSGECYEIVPAITASR